MAALIDPDELLQAYGMSSEFPDKWQDSTSTSALATLESDMDYDGPVLDGSQVVNELLNGLITTHKVPTDEPDPLGTGLTIMQLLNRKTPLSAAERAVYMPSSTSFDPQIFLRDCHNTRSLAHLERSLQFLKSQVAGHEHGRRKMVDTDYESYVTSKRRLDNAMSQLRRIGVREDTEYGTDTLKEKLRRALNELTLVAMPLDGVNTEKIRLQSALSALERNRKQLEIVDKLQSLANTCEHDQFVREFKKGSRLLGIWAQSNDFYEQKLGTLLQQKAKDVLSTYRQRLHDQLMKTPADGSYAPLITKLMDLGVSGNPALEWLEHNVEKFGAEIDDVFNLIISSTSRHFAESIESGRKLDMVFYLRILLPSRSIKLADVVDNLNNTYGIDNESCLSQWKYLISCFEKLRLVLNRCAVFYREFLSLSNASSSSSWQLSEAEVHEVTQQCEKLVRMTGRRLVESLNVSVSDAITLPIAGEYARDSESHQLSDTTDRLAFLPFNSNSLAASKYLCLIFEIVVVMASQISELIPIAAASQPNPLSQALSVVRQQFTKTICQCWTRDAQQLGSIQDWSHMDKVYRDAKNSPTFPDYFTIFHGLVLEKLRFMLDSNRGGPAPTSLLNHLTKIFPAALSLSIRSVEVALIESTRQLSLSDAQEAAQRAKLQPVSLSQDAKLLVTLNNLETLRLDSLERIYSQFESVLRYDHVDLIRQEVTPEVDKIAAQLFDVYIRKKRSKLSQIVHEEFTRLVPIWQANNQEVRRVSNYIYECLMILVDTHALFMESCAQMTKRALLELYMHLLDTILNHLRNLDTLSRQGSLQNITDLEFMRWALSQFPSSSDICQRIFSTIRDISNDDDIWLGKDGPREIVRGPLHDSIANSQFAFICFKSFK